MLALNLRPAKDNYTSELFSITILLKDKTVLFYDDIMLSILWRWKVDNILPDKFDLIGAGIALIGVIIIMYAPRG